MTQTKPSSLDLGSFHADYAEHYRPWGILLVVLYSVSNRQIGISILIHPSSSPLGDSHRTSTPRFLKVICTSTMEYIKRSTDAPTSTDFYSQLKKVLHLINNKSDLRYWKQIINVTPPYHQIRNTPTRINLGKSRVPWRLPLPKNCRTWRSEVYRDYVQTNHRALT